MTVVWMVLLFILPIILSFISYQYISQTFETRVSSIIDVADATCFDGVANVVIRNVGIDSIAISNLKFYIGGSEILPSGCSGNIQPGSTATCQVGSGLSGNVNLRIVGPSNTVSSVVFCV